MRNLPVASRADRFVPRLLLAGAALASFLVITQRTPVPALHLHEAETALLLDAPPSAPKGDSAFAQEALMTPAALITRWEPYIAEASHRFRVPADWIRAVMHMESGGRTMMGEDVPITSTTGAMGIMQVMPGTYTEMAAQYRLGADPYNPHDNVMAGAAYLKWLQHKYGNPAMFAAYNDGPGNIEAFLAHKHTLPAETHHYIVSIARMIGASPGRFAATAPVLGKVRLTRPDGAPIEIAAQLVNAVRPAAPGEYGDGVQAVISMGKTHQAVREDMTSVVATLRSHGARV